MVTFSPQSVENDRLGTDLGSAAVVENLICKVNHDSSRHLDHRIYFDTQKRWQIEVPLLKIDLCGKQVTRSHALRTSACDFYPPTNTFDLNFGPNFRQVFSCRESSGDWCPGIWAWPKSSWLASHFPFYCASGFEIATRNSNGEKTVKFFGESDS